MYYIRDVLRDNSFNSLGSCGSSWESLRTRSQPKKGRKKRSHLVLCSDPATAGGPRGQPVSQQHGKRVWTRRNNFWISQSAANHLVLLGINDAPLMCPEGNADLAARSIPSIRGRSSKQRRLAAAARRNPGFFQNCLWNEVGSTRRRVREKERRKNIYQAWVNVGPPKQCLILSPGVEREMEKRKREL